MKDQTDASRTSAIRFRVGLLLAHCPRRRGRQKSPPLSEWEPGAWPRTGDAPESAHINNPYGLIEDAARSSLYWVR